MGKKVMKLFLDTMLRAAVIILAVAIVVMLVLLARTVSKSKKSDASDTGNKTSIVTEESDPSDPTFGGSGDAADSSDTSADDSSQDASTDDANAGNGKDAKVVVLNASGVSGVAATWQTTLTADGYTSVDIGTYDNGDQSTTVIYTSDSYDVSGYKYSRIPPENRPDNVVHVTFLGIIRRLTLAGDYMLPQICRIFIPPFLQKFLPSSTMCRSVFSPQSIQGLSRSPEKLTFCSTMVPVKPSFILSVIFDLKPCAPTMRTLLSPPALCATTISLIPRDASFRSDAFLSCSMTNMLLFSATSSCWLY